MLLKAAAHGLLAAKPAAARDRLNRECHSARPPTGHTAAPAIPPPSARLSLSMIASTYGGRTGVPRVAYAVKEIFLTLQGEGAQAGRAAVFCRFAGCNLWSGREADRASAQCNFCDTDFVGTDGTRGSSYASAAALAGAIEDEWGAVRDQRFVVLTGGEPLLQADAALLEALHARGFAVAVETNGTVDPPPGLDWICVSPKAGTELKVRAGDELKLVYPQAGAPPEAFVNLAFRRFSLQPMDGPDVADNTARAIDYCLRHPQWRLSLQTHKTIGIR
jgi:7-carboxy-7-deazaguanine synthase (Cx14CxxC type)